MSRYGNINHDEEWNERPLEKYLEYKKDKVTQARLAEMERTLVKAPDGSDFEAWDEFLKWRDEMTVADAEDFLANLENAGLSDTTVEHRFHTVQSFLAELMERSDIVDSNPVAFVNDKTEFETSSTNKFERSVDQVGTYIRGIKDQQFRAVAAVFGKTGIRRGENDNIDLPHIHINDEIFYQLLDDHGISLHKEISDKPDSLYIPSEPLSGEEYREEVRDRGNKRERDTIIPIDKELKQALIDWLAVRPITTYPHPLWTTERGSKERMGGPYMGRKVKEWGQETGFVGGETVSEFTPHWFRYFFTTQLQPGYGDHPDYLEPTMVKYLRGDVMEDDMLEHYTQAWGDTIRREYLDAIYQFHIYDRQHW